MKTNLLIIIGIVALVLTPATTISFATDMSLSDQKTCEDLLWTWISPNTCQVPKKFGFAGEITIHDNVILEIPKNITLTNYGTIFNLGEIKNNGIFDNNEGTIDNKGLLTNNGLVKNIGGILNDYGTITGSGKITGYAFDSSKNVLPPLKQFKSGVSLDDIECKNNKHVLVERPNGKIACVYYETSVKLNWQIINADTNSILSVYELPVNGALYDIEYAVKGGTITNMMQNEESNSLLITIDSNKDGEITLHIPHGVIDPIPKDSGDNWLIVLVNGEEVQSEQDVDDKLNRTVSLKFNHPDPMIELIAAYWI